MSPQNCLQKAMLFVTAKLSGRSVLKFFLQKTDIAPDLSRSHFCKRFSNILKEQSFSLIQLLAIFELNAGISSSVEHKLI